MHLVLHVGPPKTGSTALQSALLASREELERAGILAWIRKPANGSGLSTLYQRGGRMQPFLRAHYDFETMEQARRWSEGNWQDFETDIRRARPALTILSGETFIALGDHPDFVGRLRALFDRITVTAYARDPVSLFVSGLDQRIRAGARSAGLIGETFQPYAHTEALRSYAASFGTQNMVVRNLARDNLAGGDVVTDFAAVVARLSGHELRLTPGEGNTNEGLCGAAVAWLLLLNETLPTPRTPRDANDVLRARRTLTRRLQQAPALKSLPKLGRPDAEVIGHIRACARDTCIWLNETFLHDQQPLPVAPPPGGAPDHDRLRARLVTWLLGYLDGDAATLIGREVLQLPPPDRAPLVPARPGG